MDIPKGYQGKYIGIIDQSIVACGKTTLEVYKKLKETNKEKIITFMYVPRKEDLLTFL